MAAKKSDTKAPPAARHTLKFSRKAWLLIKRCLESPEWYERRSQAYRASWLLAEPVFNRRRPELIAEEYADRQRLAAAVKAHRREVQAWDGAIDTLEVGEQDRDTLRVCLRRCMEKNHVPLCAELGPVLMQLGLDED